MNEKFKKIYTLPFAVYGVIFSPIIPLILLFYIAFVTKMDLGSVIGYIILMGFLLLSSLSFFVLAPTAMAKEFTITSKGGKTFTLNGKGFDVANLQNNKVQVCGYPATIVSATSTNLEF